jgi:hypothetical protein
VGKCCCCCQNSGTIPVDDGRNGEWLVVCFTAVTGVEDWGSVVTGSLSYRDLNDLLVVNGRGELGLV